MSETIAHLLDLRRSLLYCFASVAVIFLALIGFSKSIYTFFATPLLKFLPENSHMIAIDVTTPFFVPMKLTLVLAIFLAVPFIFYQLWRFVAPGLYREEKRLFLPTLSLSLILFYSGILFAYFVVLPLCFSFFIHSAPSGVLVMTDISEYLNFILKMFFAFGLSFQIPVIIVLLCKLKVISPQAFSDKRSYVIIAAFVIGMLLTPPDVFSQTLLAIPLWLLFELGLWIAKKG